MSEKEDNMGPSLDPKTSMPTNPQIPSRYLSFLGVCSLTAATLVLVGFVGEIRGPGQSKSNSRVGINASSERFVSIDSMRRLATRILSVGLPFYAVSKLGGERTAIVFLVALAAELTTRNPYVEERTRHGGWTKLILARKWTAMALILQCFCDLLNLTNNLPPLQTVSGYLALGVSILLLPWPYPSSTSKVATINSPMVNQSLNPINAATLSQDPSTAQVSELSSASSPMISTSRDTDLTVASGVLATVISFIVFVFSSQQTQTLTLKLLLGGSIVSIASCLSLLFANPKTILLHKKSSLGIGLGFSIVVQELIDSHPLLPILFQTSLAVFSWLSVYLDSKSQVSRHGHIHHASHSHSAEERHSKITSMLLHFSEDWTLLHSILLEKDSRRILYFMR